MRRVMRPLAVFSIASGVALAVSLQLAVGGAHGGSAPDLGVSFFSGHDLAKVKILENTLYHVDESYVEPGRIDWERMFVAGLESVERRVPSCMFTREPGGRFLAVEIGEFRTVLEVEPVDSRKRLLSELRHVAGLLDKHLDPDDIPTDRPDDIPFAELEYALVNGVLSTLDPHSVLLPPEDSKEMDVENEGEFGGLGITIVDRDGRLTIESPLPDYPAARAGLQPDDRIVRIDGESTINMSLDEAVTRLRGPVEAPVLIQVEREAASEPLEFEIVREFIKINPVKGKLLDGGIGLVEIKSFHQRVEGDLHAELAKLHRDAGPEGLRGLVLDLRGNPGGYLTQAVNVSDTFLESGGIVSTVAAEGRKRDQEDAKAQGTEPYYPMAVLVNANSASASEIVAGALRNNDRAVIIGERSFGKGSVQNLHEMFDDSKLKITISKYLTPGDRSIQSVGIPADIQLEPAIIQPAGSGAEGETTEEHVVRLYHRERVRREADLDQHLERTSYRVEEPAYRIRYRQVVDGRRPPPEEQGPDAEVLFARDVLLAAPSWHRGEILAAASRVVGRARDDGNDAIVSALSEVGIDWRDGPAAPRAPDGALPLSVRLDLGEDGVLVAGEEEHVRLEVTNTGDRPLYRLTGIAEGHDYILDGKEFPLGHLAPGDTRSWSHRLRLHDGYGAEHTPLTFAFRDTGDGLIGSWSTDVRVEPKELPAFHWTWSLAEAEGDGDGMLEIGELVRIDLEVENVGSGPSREAFARIHNRSRKALDLRRGTLEIGYVVDESGAPCELVEAGVDGGTVVGDPEAPRVAAGKPPVWAEDCSRVLDAGATWAGSFEVELRDRAPRGQDLRVELTLGDARAYDYASVMRHGFYSYFTQKEDIILQPGGPSMTSEERAPPQIEITRAPDVYGTSDRATVSGVVRDGRGVSHVMIYAGEDKVFTQGAGSTSDLRSVPFTADVELEPGANVITVLATDVSGHRATQSVVTWYSDVEVARANDPDAETAPIP